MHKVILGMIISIVIITSCKKSSLPPVSRPIQGLWVGTYSNNVDTFFFSLSVYDDNIQSLSYEQHAADFAINFGHGAWSVTGKEFVFSASPDTGPFTYYSLWGSAIYDSVKRTLTNGILKDSLTGKSYTWSMSKLN